MTKRHHIPLKSKLAAALACLLPSMERNYYREHNTPADEILKLFEFDHIVLHSHGGSDLWWNLDPKSKSSHREKSRRDIAIVAKVKRLSVRERDRVWMQWWHHERKTLEKIESPPTKRSWPKRKLRNRPFPKRGK
jgi:hypothetical protein